MVKGRHFASTKHSHQLRHLSSRPHTYHFSEDRLCHDNKQTSKLSISGNRTLTSSLSRNKPGWKFQVSSAEFYALIPRTSIRRALWSFQDSCGWLPLRKPECGQAPKSTQVHNSTWPHLNSKGDWEIQCSCVLRKRRDLGEQLAVFAACTIQSSVSEKLKMTA